MTTIQQHQRIYRLPRRKSIKSTPESYNILYLGDVGARPVNISFQGHKMQLYLSSQRIIRYL